MLLRLTCRRLCTAPVPAIGRTSVPRLATPLVRDVVGYDELGSLLAQQPDAEQVSSVLARMERHKQTDLAWRFYQQLHKAGSPLDAELYQRFLRLVGDVGSQTLAKRALHIEADMRAAGQFRADDPQLASTLMRVMAAAGDFPRAEACFAEQEASAAASGMPLPKGVLVDFLAACARAGEAARARQVYAEHVGAEGALRLPKAFGAVVRACARGGDLDGARRLYDEGVAAGVRPDHVLLNALLAGCVHERDLPQALQLYREARGRGVRPDAHTVRRARCCTHELHTGGTHRVRVPPLLRRLSFRRAP